MDDGLSIGRLLHDGNGQRFAEDIGVEIVLDGLAFLDYSNPQIGTVFEPELLVVLQAVSCHCCALVGEREQHPTLATHDARTLLDCGHDAGFLVAVGVAVEDRASCEQ